VDSYWHELFSLFVVTIPEVPQLYPLPTYILLTHGTTRTMRHYVDKPYRFNSQSDVTKGRRWNQIINQISLSQLEIPNDLLVTSRHTYSCPDYWHLSNTSQCTGRCLPTPTRVYAVHNDVHRIVGTDALILNVCAR